MLHAGLDLSRKKVDVCLLSEAGEHLDQLAAPPDADSLRRLARRIEEVHREPVCAVVESMTGARLVHDTLEQEGWAVEIADAQKVKGLAPLCLQDRQDRLAGPGDALPARPGAGDLASRSPHPRGARARPLSPPPGQAPLDAQAPRPLDPDQLRQALPGHRSVRARGQAAARTARGPGALARERQRLGGADRRPRRADRSDQPPAQRRPRRPPLHPAL
jgi:hypothetical protein